MPSSTSSLLLLGGLIKAVTVGATPIVARDGSSPALPFDPNTTKSCNWWADLTTEISCTTLLEDNFITLENFRRWNPSITASCGNLVVGKSYCVEASNEPIASTTVQTPIISSKPAPSTSKTSTSAVIVTSSTLSTITSKSSAIASTTSKSTAVSTTTSAGNGVTTPQPTQPGMVSNCAKFKFVEKGLGCSQVLSSSGITLEDFFKWNPSVGSDCTGMWAEVNVCVGVIGGSTPPKTSSTTKPVVTPSPTTSAGNGVQTPQPTQPGMVSNCAKFKFVEKGLGCSQVLSSAGITLADFFKWNPNVGSDCSGMWAEVNVCVGVIGGSTPTTSAGNGIQTPQPTQPGMVTNCNKFHFISPGNVCSQITSFNKISLADFVKWNPTVRSDCTGMQANVNVCVGVIGGSTTPTPTTSAGNGIQTPQPTQPGMVTNCKKFHFADTGVVCSQITSFNKISLADFVKWNSGVGSDCKNMWAKTYTCVGV
ncbi:hypothetical protein GQ44DRAFT_763437 [Phaeosphaeriaceae sp. PMI808]|nr:hypothetical protein GQ44DRAFT_763437 [Phaeosphaeriaceae sp. PMI808]